MQRLNFRPMLIDSLKGYTRQGLTRDLLAGLIVGIVALPMAIAFAIASGVSPEVGLVTAVLGGLIVSALGGSSVQIGGPTGAFIIIVLGIIGEYGQGGLLIATLMAGILLLLMGALKLGSLIKFIPYPIILGFTAGIAVTIFTTQVNDLLGLGLTVYRRSLYRSGASSSPHSAPSTCLRSPSVWGASSSSSSPHASRRSSLAPSSPSS